MAIRASLALAFAVALGACADSQTPPHGVTISVAPLDLPGVGVACYDIAVTTANGTVWTQGDPAYTHLGADQTLPPDPNNEFAYEADERTICSDRYGNGIGGDITYVGTCDASADADTVEGGIVQNTVTIWVDGLYEDEKFGTISDWQNPCPNGCSLEVDCKENEDTLVSFELTVMRAAQQGFFDVAVNFGDVFCSAKLDTCYGDAPADKHIELLFGGDDKRDWTAVMGFACSGGAGTDTVLAYGDIKVTCDGGATFTLDPSVEPGSNRTATSGTNVLHYGVYRDAEQLDCDDPETAKLEGCGKLFWNLAIDLADLATLGNCKLDAVATAADDADLLDGGSPSGVGLAWPYVVVSANLTVTPFGQNVATPFCQVNPLNGGDEVKTTYYGTIDGLETPPSTCFQYDGVSAEMVCTCPCWDTEEIVEAFRAIAEDYAPLSYAEQRQIAPGQAMAFQAGGIPMLRRENPEDPESPLVYVWSYQVQGQVDAQNGRCRYQDFDSVTEESHQRQQQGLSPGAVAACMETMRAIDARTACPCWDTDQLGGALDDVLAGGDYRVDYESGAPRLRVAVPERSFEGEEVPVSFSIDASGNYCNFNWRNLADNTQVMTSSFGITPAQSAVCAADVRAFAAKSWACDADLSSCSDGFTVLSADDACSQEECVSF